MSVEHAKHPHEVVRSLAAVEEVAASRERMRSRLLGRERTVTLLLAAGFLAAAIAVAELVPWEGAFTAWIAVLCVLTYAVLAQVEFEIGPGSSVPTGLVFVPMLFVLPPAVVPLLVAGGLVLGGLVESLHARRHRERVTVLLCSSWYSIGPAVVIGTLAPGPPERENAHIYVLALGAQFALDGLAVLTRHWAGRGLPLARLLAPLGWVAFVDAALAPVAIVIAFVAVKEPFAILAVLPLGALLHAQGSERRRRIDEGLVLGRAVEDATRVARSDPLTGVGNRLAWQEALHRAVQAESERRVPTSVLLVDLNGLKHTNDTHGHDMGDRLIQALASTLEQALPEGAELARIGGDEFAILAVGTDARSCDELVFHIRRDLAELTVSGVPVLASIGAASTPPSASLEAALRLADERLYAGKRTGLATS